MFSFRLRIILVVLILAFIALLARAVQVQWLQYPKWLEAAERRMEDVSWLQTHRGRILDVKGRELAADAACIDAVVDYRVILDPPDEAWVREYARARLKRQLGHDYFKAGSARQIQLIDEQAQQVKADIRAMWDVLGDAKLSGATRQQIEERRQQTIRRVQMLRRYLWYERYVRAEKQRDEQSTSWWLQWLSEGDGEVDLDAFAIEIAEERESHVILPAISADLANYLGKHSERFPGLSLRQGQHRVYPFGESACHLIGHIRLANAEDVKGDAQRDDSLRRYLPTDWVGRNGVEAMCEQTLRGSRGRLRRDRRNGRTIESVPATPGRDVQLSIDIELQKKIEAAFSGGIRNVPVVGAAVLIDVPTGEVRAMVSYPTYDLNQLDQIYAQLVSDEIDRPLFNRATMAQLEPGSTVKPLVGLAGVSEGVVKVHEGIECTGYLVVDGREQKGWGKCWTVATAKAHHIASAAHHPFPVPHRGRYGNRDGYLIFADALERSCNVWCETVADRLGLERVSWWYRQFGLGEPTGIGLPEVAGRLPDGSEIQASQRRSLTWFAGIGQGHMAATPLQMANACATIAREGVWMRPQLVIDGDPRATTQPQPQRRVLPLAADALQAAKEGMINSVNGPAGTGKAAYDSRLTVAGKTGTAQAARLSVPVRDEQGELVRVDGKVQRRILEPSTATHFNPEAPWYRGGGADGKELNHAWFIGFAPAQRPKVAFAVMVEYGGSGGVIAGPIVKAMLEAAMREGYLAPVEE